MRFRSENLAQPVREYERAFLDPKTKRGKLTEPIPSQYESLLREIKERIRSAQLAALRQVNHEITLYSDIGRLIVARQEGDTWGKSVVANLAKDLHAEFPGA